MGTFTFKTRTIPAEGSPGGGRGLEELKRGKGRWEDWAELAALWALRRGRKRALSAVLERPGEVRLCVPRPELPALLGGGVCRAGSQQNQVAQGLGVMECRVRGWKSLGRTLIVGGLKFRCFL